MIGRQLELGAIDAAAGRLTRGSGRAIAIGGDAGIGKTRLARNLAGRARGRGWTVMWGGCSEAELSLPYLAVHEALAGYLDGSSTTSPEQVVAALGPRAAPLATIVPSLGPLVTDHEPAGAVDRLRLFDSVLAMFRLIASSGPMVLVIDDAHWADGPTIELIDYLGRGLDSLALLLVVTYRPDETTRTHPMSAVLRSWRRSAIGTTISLKPLDRAGVHDLLRSVFGDGAVTDGLADLATERSEGNPFVLEELVRDAVERGDVFATADGLWHRKPNTTLMLPATVAESILARTDRLDESALDVLHGAAIIGRSFDLTLLRQVCGCSETDVLTALDASAEHQLVEEDPGTTNRFRFRHALTHEAIIGELPVGPRRRLHARAAVALMESGAPPLDIAVHLLAAGKVGEAVPWCWRAGREAERVGAYTTAAELYERALPGATAPVERARTQARLGRALLASGQMAAARERLSEAVRELDAVGLGTEAAVTSVELGRALWRCQRPGEALLAFGRARADLEAADRAGTDRDPASGPERGESVEAALASAYAHLAGIHLFEMRAPEALLEAARGVQVATAAGADASRLLGEVFLGMALVETGQRDAGVARLDSVVAEMLDRGLWELAGVAVRNNVWMRCFSLRAAEAGPVIALLDRPELKAAGEPIALFSQALVARYLGHHDICLARARALRDVAGDVGMAPMLSWARELEIHALVELGELDAAVALLPFRPLEEQEAQERREWGPTRLRLLLAQREFAQAAAMARHWLSEGPWPLRDPMAAAAVVEALVSCGDHGRVAALIPSLVAAMEAEERPHALHLLALGQAQLAAADPGHAVASLRRAVDGLCGAGYRVFEARARLHLARALVAGGDPLAAATEEATAMALARASSSQLILRHAAQDQRVV